MFLCLSCPVQSINVCTHCKNYDMYELYLILKKEHYTHIENERKKCYNKESKEIDKVSPNQS